MTIMLSKVTNMKKHILTSYRIFIRSISYGAPKWAIANPGYGPMEVQRSELLNGVRIAAAKHLGSQISACTIMFQAGSRYECGDYIGASHFVRATTSAAAQGHTAYSKFRVLQQYGAYLTCSSDRQSIAFTMRCPLPVFCDLKHYLLDTAARCCYNEWDIDDRKPLVREDLYRITPEQRVMDLIQSALWTGPLSNSIYCAEERIDEMSENRLSCFAQVNFKSNCCSIASVGVPFDEIMKIAEKIDPKREKPTERMIAPSCPRNGFEYFDMGKDSDTWIAVAVPGCGTKDLANLLKHAIIAAACGTGNVQMGQHDLDRTLQPPLGLMAGADFFTEYKAFNISYAETGLFGIVAKTRAATARKAALAVTEFLANVGDLNFKQLEVGKKRLKLSLLLNDDDCTQVSQGLALQLASNVQMDSANNSCCMIDMICPDEITLTAKSISAKHLRCINVKTALNTIQECKPVPKLQSPKLDIVSKAKTVYFTPRSIGFEINDKPVNRKIKDPLNYTPITNPRSILPLIDTNWRKDEIGLPAIQQEEKQAIRLIVIRRKKMKKHKRMKLWKRMRFRWARIKKNRRIKKEKIFQNELLALVKQANEFSAEQYVAEKLRKANHTPLPTTWKHKRLPAFIIRQLLGLDKKINYKHTDVYKA
ncbi:cytochrome b-c1 complex subunit 2, mitochondrial-like [Epargyreus clarus]|uniref:cytochrome b-c1 complex subunit 2, mitochondrial-like n=1 Tax=Epargyreus clarus TaxID=520877 RepID=UPI003C2AB251